jgi:hypothetical protein
MAAALWHKPLIFLAVLTLPAHPLHQKVFYWDRLRFSFNIIFYML